MELHYCHGLCLSIFHNVSHPRSYLFPICWTIVSSTSRRDTVVIHLASQETIVLKIPSFGSGGLEVLDSFLDPSSLRKGNIAPVERFQYPSTVFGQDKGLFN
jgi:hypothetical protein